MQAVILAGGLGTRLHQIVGDVPKPMASVAGRPFLARLMDHLAAASFNSLVLSVGHKRETIMATFGSRYGRLTLAYAVEHTPLGTGGAMKNAWPLVCEDPVFVLNGDTFVEIDFRAMRQAHEAAGTRLTIALIHVDNAARYGRVVVEDGRLIAFEAKARPGPGLINAGVYLVGKAVLTDPALPTCFSFEHELLATRLDALRPRAFLTEGRFIDIGVPEDYVRAQQLFAAADLRLGS